MVGGCWRAKSDGCRGFETLLVNDLGCRKTWVGSASLVIHLCFSLRVDCGALLLLRILDNSMNDFTFESIHGEQTIWTDWNSTNVRSKCKVIAQGELECS
jgi:hypothetical protein